MKRCCSCKIEKPECEFGGDRSQKDGLARRCKACILEKARRRYRDNGDHVKLQVREYKARHRAAIASKATAYNKANAKVIAAKMKADRAANPEKTKQIARRYRQKNYDKVLDRIHLRNARKRNNGPVERVSRRKVWERDDGICHLCKDPVEFRAMHLDHVVPICKGGTHTYGNVKVACAPCNLRKNGKLLEEVA